jgi:hypothetical protein
LILPRFGFGFVARLLCGHHLEFFHGAGDVADLVPAAEARQHHLEIAFGKRFHGNAERPHGPGNRENRKDASRYQQQGGGDADGQRGALGRSHLPRRGRRGLFRLELGELDDLVGSLFQFGRERQRHLAGDADRLIVELRALRGSLGRQLTTRRPRCLHKNGLAPHRGDLLGAFGVVGGLHLELFDSRSIFRRMR